MFTRLAWRSDHGSAPVEFSLVGVLVVTLVLGVLQLALAQHVRNTLLDAASEGARWAALADSSLSAGEQRTAALISMAIGDAYSADISSEYVRWNSRDAVAITVAAPLPLIGLLGPATMLKVTGHATREPVTQ